MRFRLYLEQETRILRDRVRDAEAWLARWEIEAALVDEVEAAEELVRFWRRQWAEHLELCDWFAGFAARVLAREMNTMALMKGMAV